MQIQVKDIKDIKEVKTFHPFVLELKIESEQDVVELLARFNFSVNDVNQNLREQELQPIKELPHAAEMWNFLYCLYKNKPYMK